MKAAQELSIPACSSLHATRCLEAPLCRKVHETLYQSLRYFVVVRKNPATLTVFTAAVLVIGLLLACKHLQILLLQQNSEGQSANRRTECKSHEKVRAKRVCAIVCQLAHRQVQELLDPSSWPITKFAILIVQTQSLIVESISSTDTLHSQAVALVMNTCSHLWLATASAAVPSVLIMT